MPPVDVASEIDAIFAPGGALARALPGFAFRPEQLEMARAVAETIAHRGRLIAEAGTGTGKTFAYLVPALLDGGKVIISTGTKTLQDQLYERDLPLVRDALRSPATIALLKGRANYLCLHRLDQISGGTAAPPDSAPGLGLGEESVFLPMIREWAHATETGDRA